MTTMPSYQQRIPLKGTEDSIDCFAHLLKSIKDKTGINSAEVLLRSLAHWHTGGGSAIMSKTVSCTAADRLKGISRVFYLQLLTPPDIMHKINCELDRLRREYTLKTLLDQYGVGRAEYLLESLILILDCFQASKMSVMPPIGLGRPPVSHRNEIPSETMHRSPSVRLTPARDIRCGSTGPELTDHRPHHHSKHLTSWRQRLREQQLAENKKLNESIRRTNGHLSATSQNLKDDRENGHPHGLKHARSVLQTKNLQHHDNKEYKWLPVHEAAMKSHDFGSKNKENEERFKFARDSSEPPPSATASPCRQRRKMCSNIRAKVDLDNCKASVLSLKDRKRVADKLLAYLNLGPPEYRITPGYSEPLTSNERLKEGVDCDEVFPGVVLGNGGTVKKKAFLKKIGITHILNAAEFRGVNVGRDYFNKPGDNFQYMGIRIEDTPQTQICRYFVDVAEFIEDALMGGGKIFVNCVFGKSRSSTCIIAFMMLCHNWDALNALEQLRKKRPIELNRGFLQQLVDLEHKLQWKKNQQTVV